MQCDSTEIGHRVAIIKECYRERHPETFTTHEGLAEFKGKRVEIFVAEQALCEGSKYRFTRTSRRTLPSTRRCIRVFDARQIEKG